ncbi:MAG: helix-turn-helix transcriptional regulator [Clostridia bacterium]|nr:helix-turn-helix transcriptional regulator [Clostridia bacterium]
MKLPVSQVIKRLRNERNITQEELANFLGVTCQSVSRWENGIAYPDVEFFPLIASYFGISTDVLFGTDEVTRKFKMQEYLSGIKELENIIDNKKFKMLESLLRAAIADFPENIYFNWKLCSLYWRMGLEYAKENLNTMRKCAQFVIDNDKSVDGSYRIGCIRVMIRVEDEERLGNWTKYVSESFDTSLPSIMASRFKYRKETENYNEQIQKNLRDSLRDTFLRDFGKIDKNGNPKPASRTAGQRTILSIIDSMRDASVEKDAWLAERAFAHLRLSS